MDNSEEMVIRITKNGQVFVQETDDKIISYKEISLEAFYKCINDSVNRGKIISGILPKNCFYFTHDDSGSRYVALEFNDPALDVTYENTLYEQFPLPKMVFGFSVSKEGNIYSKSIGIVENKPITLDSKMYVYPFSNVTEFSICTGSNSMPKIKNLSQLNGIPYYILAMPNNDDHFSSGRNKLGLESRALFEHLKDKNNDYYYSDVLIESSKTISNFIKYKGEF